MHRRISPPSKKHPIGFPSSMVSYRTPGAVSAVERIGCEISGGGREASTDSSSSASAEDDEFVGDSSSFLRLCTSEWPGPCNDFVALSW